MTARTTTTAVQDDVYQRAYYASNLEKPNSKEESKPLQRLAEKAPPVAGKRRGATLVPFLLDHACHHCERGGADRRRPAVPRYVLAQAARPFLASIIIQETCRERSCRG
jgi:hypothetical protein